MKSKRFQYLMFIVLTLFVGLIPFVFDIYYATPDDPRYIGLVSGAYTGTPVKELVYIGTLLGAFEAWLYSAFSGIEWYSVVYYILTLIGYCILIYCVLTHQLKKLEKVGLLFLLTTVQIYLSLSPQFTILATQLGLVSFVTILLANGRRRLYVMGLVIFFFATQMRFAAACLPYMIGFPLLLQRMNIRNRLWRAQATWLMGLLVVACLTFFADKYVYRSEKWEKFHVTNDARAYLADNPIAEKYAEELTGEEEELAYTLFYKYRLFELNIISPEKFQEYQRKISSRALTTIRYNLKPYLQVYMRMGLWIVVCVGFWLIYVLIQKRHWWLLSLYAMSVFLFMCANLQMMSLSFYKERVMLGTFAALLFVTLFLVSAHARHGNKVILGVCLIIGCQYLYKDYKALCRTTSSHEIVEETEGMIRASDTEKVMLLVPDCLTPEAFHTSQSPIYKNSVIQGWMHFYPGADSRYQPFTAFVNGLPILVDKTATEQLDLISRLLLLHYGINTQVESLQESEHYKLVRLVRSE